MAQEFKEVAHLKTDMTKYGPEHERIFGVKKKPCGWCNDSGREPETGQVCRRGCEDSTPTPSAKDDLRVY